MPPLWLAAKSGISSITRSDAGIGHAVGRLELADDLGSSRTARV